MNRRVNLRVLAAATMITLLLGNTTNAAGQWGVLGKAGACAALGYGGYKFAEVLASWDAKRQNLSPAEARRREIGFKVGLTLAACGIGAKATDTVFDKLSKRGRENRESQLRAALADTTAAQPREYSDPNNAALRGRISAQPVVQDGNKECRVVEDTLADAGHEDSAFIKYCLDGSEWKPVLR